MATSQNGWPANDRDLTKSWKIPGTTRAIRLESGDAGFLLVHFAAWFDANIETIDTGELDDWGYAERPVRGGTDLSNHASGTAEDLNATRHPLAVRNTFSKAQMTRIREKLKEYDGVLRWGGDYKNRADEMHVEINASRARVAAVAKRLRGAPANPSTPGSKPVGATIHRSALQYAANGGYFHSGQAQALGEVLIFLGWYDRRGRARGGAVQVQFQRDIRVWKSFCEQAHNAKTAKAETEAWRLAGNQFKGIVKRVQALYGLTPDGIVGPKTGAVLANDNYNVVP